MRECVAFDASPALEVDMEIVEFSALRCQEFEKWIAVEDGILRGLLVKVVNVEVQTLQMRDVGKPRFAEAVDVYRQTMAVHKRGGYLVVVVLIRTGNLTVWEILDFQLSKAGQDAGHDKVSILILIRKGYLQDERFHCGTKLAKHKAKADPVQSFQW